MQENGRCKLNRVWKWDMIHYIYKITFLKGLSGRYYLGKRDFIGDDISKDKYAGSGSFCKTYYKKYGKILGETYLKEIVEINKTIEINDEREIIIIGDLWKTDPMCMNLRPGGFGGISCQKQSPKPVLQYDRYGNFIAKYESAKIACEAIGEINRQYISKACKAKTTNAFGYIWRYWNEPLQQEELENIFFITKPIKQYTSDLDFIKQWDSIMEASITLNIDKNSIGEICNRRNKNRHTAGGFVWCFYDEDPICDKTVPYTGRRKVKQFDKFGKLIKEYPSLQEAARNTNTKWQAIQRCCNRKRCQTGGFIWRFSDDDYVSQKIIDHVIESTKKNRYHQIDLDGNVIKKYNTLREIATEFKGKESTINSAMNKKKLLYGYYWEKV